MVVTMWHLQAILLIGWFLNSTNGLNVGYFWHVADMHWDPTYAADSKALSCGPNTTGTQFGRYGDYRCDPPYALLESAVKAMHRIKSDVDFLIWTGDDTPHIWNDTILHKGVVSEIVMNQSDILQQVFPDYIVYAAMGNHDWSPKGQLPPGPDPFYEDIAEKWEPWLDENATLSFKKAAYYTMPAPDNPNLRMVVLNTNLYYDSNELTKDMPDPANQLQWFDDVLTAAALSDEKVIVVAHVPPGVFEKHRDYHWFYPFYNEVFSSLLKKHSATIGSIHMAHHHTDSFRVLYDDVGTPVSSIFLAPAVTPWETTLPDVMGGAGNNPSIRLIQYNRDTGNTLDVHQYYLNLTKANADLNDNWELEYDGTKYFGVADMSPSSLDDIAQRMQTDDELFGKYYMANGVLYDPNEKWTEETRRVHYCAIVHVDYEDYGYCVNQADEVSAAVNINLRITCVVSCLALWLERNYIYY